MLFIAFMRPVTILMTRPYKAHLIATAYYYNIARKTRKQIRDSDQQHWYQNIATGSSYEIRYQRHKSPTSFTPDRPIYTELNAANTVGPSYSSLIGDGNCEGEQYNSRISASHPTLFLSVHESTLSISRNAIII